MPEWLGKTIGKVRIEKLLARGGTAEVYSGTHLTLDRPVAIKVLHSYIEEEPLLLQRFQREAKVVAALRHSNIVQIFDFDTIDGHPYIVMEYVRGPTLAAYLRHLHQRKKRLQLDQIAHLLQGLTTALDYAHGQGVIHRDIKPANILLHTKTGEITLDKSLPEDVEAILTDFGLVRMVDAASHTTSGIVSGTPAYMSPEQGLGEHIDYRTDIYSLGVVLYEMLAGKVPFAADNTVTILHMHLHMMPAPIPGASPKLQAVIDRALAKNPDERYQTSQEMASDFSHSIGMAAQAEAMGEPYSVSSAPVESLAEGSDSQRPAPEPPSEPALITPELRAKPVRSRVWIGGGMISLVIISLLAAWAFGSLYPRPEISAVETLATTQTQSPGKEITPTSITPINTLHTVVPTSTPTLVGTDTSIPILPIQKIDFEYEDSPMKHGWQISEANEEEIQIEHTQDPLVGNGITITSPVKYRMEFKVEPEAAQRGKVVELVANLTEESSFFTYISLVRDDGSSSKGWLKLKSSKGPPLPVDNDEWQLSIEPISSKGGSWSLYQVDLSDAVMQTFGNDGWKFQQLEKFRLRGNLSLVYIHIYEMQP